MLYKLSIKAQYFLKATIRLLIFVTSGSINFYSPGLSIGERPRNTSLDSFAGDGGDGGARYSAATHQTLHKISEAAVHVMRYS